MDKSVIRNKLYANRAEAFSSDKEGGSDAAMELASMGEAYLNSAYSVIKPGVSVVAGYVPIGSEIDPRPLMAVFQARGASLCLPEVVSPDQPLQFRSWQAGDMLVTGYSKTLQPMESAPVVKPDFILLPLVGVDQHGVRLGQGGGFYDRSLEALTSEALTGEALAGEGLSAFGVAFDEQMVSSLPKEAHDQYLDGLFSPGCCKVWDKTRQVSYVAQK